MVSEDAKLVRELLDYNEQTGEFRFKSCLHRGKRWNSRWAGKMAGGPHNSGYWSINFKGTKHLAHRLAWLHAYGEWPKKLIDHINLDRRDNRLSNLRLATSVQNCSNAKTRTDSTSGFRGVWFRSDRGKWCAQIHHAHRRRHLGTFESHIEAHHAYAKAAVEIYGDFCPLYLRDGQ